MTLPVFPRFFNDTAQILHNTKQTYNHSTVLHTRWKFETMLINTAQHFRSLRYNVAHRRKLRFATNFAH